MRRHSIALSLTLALAATAACKSKTTDPSTMLAPEAQHGRELYERMCSVCHGANGEGYKADEATRLSQPDFLASVNDAYLRAAIADGRAGSTMSAWSHGRGGPLSAADIESVIKFLRSWDTGPRANLDQRLLTGNPSRGKAIYEKQCERCHGAHGTGGPYVRIGNADFLASATNGFLRYAIQNGRAGTKMPAFAKSLGDTGVEDVIGFLRHQSEFAPPVVKLPPPATPAKPIPLGPVPLNPHGPDPVGFKIYPATTHADDIKKQLDRGARMAILDARAPSDYMGEHIAGAVSVPFYGVAPYADKLPKNAWLVCYCACPHAESGQLASALQEIGFKKVTVLEEGLGVWKARGYPTHKGDKP